MWYYLGDIAFSLASFIRSKLNLPDIDQETIAYSITFLLILVLNLTLLTAFGLLGGVLLPTLGAAFSSGLFRVFTGGAHFNSAGICAVFSSLVMLACALAGQTLSMMGLGWKLSLAVATGVNLGLSIWIFAPVAASGRPIADWERQRFRHISLWLLPAWLIVTGLGFERYPALALASLFAANWQALTLTPVGQRVYGLVDQTVCILGCMSKGGHQHD